MIHPVHYDFEQSSFLGLTPVIGIKRWLGGGVVRSDLLGGTFRARQARERLIDLAPTSTKANSNVASAKRFLFRRPFYDPGHHNIWYIRRSRAKDAHDAK
jgi:hypothetical protein